MVEIILKTFNEVSPREIAIMDSIGYESELLYKERIVVFRKYY